MKMAFKEFLADESGAVTVDWVVLTAAVVGLGFSIILVFADGNKTVADNISSTVANVPVETNQ